MKPFLTIFLLNILFYNCKAKTNYTYEDNNVSVTYNVTHLGEDSILISASFKNKNLDPIWIVDDPSYFDPDSYNNTLFLNCGFDINRHAYVDMFLPIKKITQDSPLTFSTHVSTKKNDVVKIMINYLMDGDYKSLFGRKKKSTRITLNDFTRLMRFASFNIYVE